MPSLFFLKLANISLPAVRKFDNSTANRSTWPNFKGWRRR